MRRVRGSDVGKEVEGKSVDMRRVRGVDEEGEGEGRG